MTTQQLIAICNAAGWLSRKLPETFEECKELEEKAEIILDELEQSDVPVNMFKHFEHLFIERLSDIADIEFGIVMRNISKVELMAIFKLHS